MFCVHFYSFKCFVTCVDRIMKTATKKHQNYRIITTAFYSISSFQSRNHVYYTISLNITSEEIPNRSDIFIRLIWGAESSQFLSYGGSSSRTFCAKNFLFSLLLDTWKNLRDQSRNNRVVFYRELQYFYAIEFYEQRMYTLVQCVLLSHYPVLKMEPKLQLTIKMAHNSLCLQSLPIQRKTSCPWTRGTFQWKTQEKQSYILT